MEWKSKEKCKFKRKMKFYNIASRAQSLPVEDNPYGSIVRAQKKT